jgi:hypothetical protein
MPNTPASKFSSFQGHGTAFAVLTAMVFFLGLDAGAEDQVAPAASAGFQGLPPIGDRSLPPPSRMKRGRIVRDEGGALSLVENSARELRICPPEGTGACQFSDLASAVAAAYPGDTLVLAPGIHPSGANVSVDYVTVRGEPGAHLKGGAVEGKGALVISGAGVTVEGLECSEISVRDRNGACIRLEAPDLTVRNVNFHDNDQGILVGGGASGTLLVENSRFERNGRGGRAHGLYVSSDIDEFVFTGNVVVSTKDEGHGVKSRAKKTVISGNIIAGLEARDSRAIDISNGGEVVIRGNVLQKGPNSSNWQMIGVALEKRTHARNRTEIEDNLFIFDTVTGADGVIGSLRRWGQSLGLTAQKGMAVRSKSPEPVSFVRNILVGGKAIGVPADPEENKRYNDRRSAGLKDFPALPTKAAQPTD